MKLNNDQKLLVHAILMDYNLQAVQIPHRNPVAAQNENEAEKFGRIIMGAQYAMSELVEVIVGTADEVSEGTKMLIGALLKQNVDALEEMQLALTKKGTEIPKEFFDKRGEMEALQELFPVKKEEERSVIVTP